MTDIDKLTLARIEAARETQRECATCEWMKTIETKGGQTVYICADEDGGNFLQEVGICGWCED